MDDDRSTILVFDRICSTGIQQNKFLPEKEIQDEKALRADYEKLRVAVELQCEIGLELNLNHIYDMILACTFELLVCDQAVILMADRIGINTDKPVAGYIGSARTMSYSVIGDSVNVAARLCSAAGPGEILISDNTYQHVEGRFKVAESDPILAKGKSQPIKAYSVLAK
ncbi:MAG: adenylate/guanylate cyclase domain-containing protein [Syntrophobacter sp.]